MDCNFKMPDRCENSHKGSFGKVLNISGSDFMTGAAGLSSLSALKIGAGMVVLCSTLKVISAISAQTKEIVFAPLTDIVNQLKSATILLAGCGLSTSNEANMLLSKIFELKNNIPTVIDADGLNLLSNSNLKWLPDDLILTPHPKEASRLLDVELDEILADLEFSAKMISKKYNCVTVLKAHNTVVCSKDFEIYINNTGNSALAKAGSGDVLAGMIAGLLAQHCEPFEAAKLGVYLHGLCGDLAKNDLTAYGVLASDLVRYIPQAIKTII